MQVLSPLRSQIKYSYATAKEFVQTHPAYLKSYEHTARFWAYGLTTHIVGMGIEKYFLGMESESALYSRAATWGLLLLGGDRIVDEFDKAVKKASPKLNLGKKKPKKITQTLAKGARLSCGVAALSFPIYYAFPEVETLTQAAVSAGVFGGLSYAKTALFQPAEEFFLNNFPSRSRHSPNDYKLRVAGFATGLALAAATTIGMYVSSSSKLPVLEKIEKVFSTSSLDCMLEKEAPQWEL